jgi:hypothetical protein
MRLAAVLLLALAVSVPVSALSVAGGPAPMLPEEGPDVPVTTPPVATLLPFDQSYWSCDGGVRTAMVTIPSVPWNRAQLTFVDDAGTDVYDRLFGVSLGGVEVMHGTTPRTNMTLTRDVTYASAAFPPGSTVPVGLFFGTYTGWQRLTVRLDFYEDPTAALVEPAHASTIPVFTFRDITVPRLPSGATTPVAVAFPGAAPSSAIVEMFTSGHGQQGEFFYLTAPHTPPVFHVLVDGVEVGNLTAMPYTYALAGFGSISCSDGTNSPLEHQAMWWTAQQALNDAGVYPGVGQIPPYRAVVPASMLPLLSGNRTVDVTYTGAEPGDANWWSSLNFHLD